MKRIAQWLFILAVLFCDKTQAQAPVDKEPHHKVVFENNDVRVIDLEIEPGDTTLLHTHTFASLVIFLSTSTFGIQNPGEQPVITHVKPGDIVYRDYDKKPVAHRVWGQSSSLFHCLVVELKKKKNQ